MKLQFKADVPKTVYNVFRYSSFISSPEKINVEEVELPDFCRVNRRQSKQL